MTAARDGANCRASCRIPAGAARLADGDQVAGLHLIAGRLGDLAVDLDVRMRDELPRLGARLPEAGAVHGVVEPPLQVLEHDLTSRALDLGRLLERVLHLTLEHAVDPARLLLLTKLQREVGHLAAPLLVHAGRRAAPLEGALRQALFALEEELHAFAAAETADRTGVTRH